MGKEKQVGDVRGEIGKELVFICNKIPYREPLLPSKMVHCSNAFFTLPNEHRSSFFTDKNQAGAEKIKQHMAPVKKCGESVRRDWKVTRGNRKGHQKRQMRALMRGRQGGAGAEDRGLTSWTGPGGRRSCSRCCQCSSAQSGLKGDRTRQRS